MKKLALPMSLLSVFVLFGCGGGGDAPATEEAAQPAAEAPAPEAAAPDMDLPEGVTAAMVAEGRDVFHGAGICFTCHMENGVGGPAAPNLTDQEWLNIDGSYESIVNNVMTGVAEPKEFPGVMLPKGGAPITDEQVQAAAAYVWTLSNGG